MRSTEEIIKDLLCAAESGDVGDADSLLVEAADELQHLAECIALLNRRVSEGDRIISGLRFLLPEGDDE